MTDIIADIGATNARFALVENGVATHVEILQGADHPNFQHAVETYLTKVQRPSLRKGAFAIAAPITGDYVQMTNRPEWSFSTEVLKRALKLEHLYIVNDFYANALALPALQANDLHQIGGGAPKPHATKLVLGPGSGLGVAMMAWTGTAWLPLPGEGGHAKLPMGGNAYEDAILGELRDRFGYVSNEHVLSGGGLANLYDAILRVKGMGERQLEQHEITAAATLGRDAMARETVNLFLAILGTVAANLTVTNMATGGVYITGGICPAIIPLVEASRFRACFTTESKMRSLIEPIPTYIVTNEHPAFVGLIRLLET